MHYVVLLQPAAPFHFSVPELHICLISFPPVFVIIPDGRTASHQIPSPHSRTIEDPSRRQETGVGGLVEPLICRSVDRRRSGPDSQATVSGVIVRQGWRRRPARARPVPAAPAQGWTVLER